MELNRRDADRLLGAWALGALDPAERTAVEQALAADPHLREQAVRLRAGVSRLATAAGTEVPTVLVESVVAAARSVPRPQHPASEPSEVYANQVRVLRTLLDTLEESDWVHVARPYEWTVHELVAHLLVIERYTAALLGFDGVVPDDVSSHLRAGADVIALERSRPPAATAREWASVADRTVEGARLLEDTEATHEVDFHGWLFTVPQLLVARAFEVWTHADDIRRATGRPTIAPGPEDLRAMSTLSVSSLPAVVSITAPARADVSARVVLTGEGGGVFDLGEPGDRRALIVADVVDYCRLAARRVSTDEFEHHIEGDDELVRDMLAAARALAV